MPTTESYQSSSPKLEKAGGGHWVNRLPRTRIAMAIVGVLLVAAAGVVRFAVLPAVAKLPANSNTTNVYTGTAPVLLNEAALAPGSTAPVLLHNLPLTIKESVKVVKANSSAAVVDYRVSDVAAGVTLPGMNNLYVVNRKTLAPARLSWPGLTATRGLTISFPIGTLRQNYTGWVQDTGTTTLLRFVGTTTHVPVPAKVGTGSYPLGFQAYVFQQSTAPTLINDRQELATLPSGIPKAEIPSLASRLHIPAAEISALASQFAKFPTTVPLAYTYAATFTYWVAPRDGVVVDLQATETRSVELPKSLIGMAVPIATVSQFVYTDSRATLLARIHEANNDASALTLVGTILPLLGLVVGLVLLVAAVLLGLRRRPRGPAVGVEEQPVEPAKRVA